MSTVIQDVPTVPVSLHDALNYLKFAYGTGTGLGRIKDAIADDDAAGWQQIADLARRPATAGAPRYLFTADDIRNAVRVANSWMLTSGVGDGFTFAKVSTLTQLVASVLVVRSDGQLASGKFGKLLAGTPQALPAAAEDARTTASFGTDRAWSLSIDALDRLALRKGGAAQLVVTPQGGLWSAGVGGIVRIVAARFAQPEVQVPELRTLWPPEAAKGDYHGWRIAVSYVGHLVFSYRDQPQAVLFGDGDLWLREGAGFAAPSPVPSENLPLGVGHMLAVLAGAGVYLASQAEGGYNLAREGVMTAVNWISGTAHEAFDWSRGAETAVASWTEQAAGDTAAWFKGASGTVEEGFDVAVSWSGTALNDAANWLKNAGDTVIHALDPTRW